MKSRNTMFSSTTGLTPRIFKSRGTSNSSSFRRCRWLMICWASPTPNRWRRSEIYSSFSTSKSKARIFRARFLPDTEGRNSKAGHDLMLHSRRKCLVIIIECSKKKIQLPQSRESSISSTWAKTMAHSCPRTSCIPYRWGLIKM